MGAKALPASVAVHDMQPRCSCVCLLLQGRSQSGLLVALAAVQPARLLSSLICSQLPDLRAAARRLTLKSLDSMPLHNPLTQPLGLLVVKLLSATNVTKADWLTQTDCFVRCCTLSPPGQCLTMTVMPARNAGLQGPTLSS